MYNYQIDYGGGYENVYPDGYGMHSINCNDSDCLGCWDQDDYEAWFDQCDNGAVERARVLFGSQVLEERVFQEDETNI